MQTLFGFVSCIVYYILAIQHAHAQQYTYIILTPLVPHLGLYVHQTRTGIQIQIVSVASADSNAKNHLPKKSCYSVTIQKSIKSLSSFYFNWLWLSRLCAPNIYICICYIVQLKTYKRNSLIAFSYKFYIIRAFLSPIIQHYSIIYLHIKYNLSVLYISMYIHTINTYLLHFLDFQPVSRSAASLQITAYSIIQQSLILLKLHCKIILTGKCYFCLIHKVVQVLNTTAHSYVIYELDLDQWTMNLLTNNK